MDTLERIGQLAGDKTTLELRLGDAIGSIQELARICEAVRYTAGLGKSQWDRVEKARAVAAKADEALQAIRARNAETLR